MKLLLALAMFVLSFTLYGQNEASDPLEEKINPVQINLSEACNKDKRYWTVQELPEYVGGNEKLVADLNSHLSFDKDISGKVNISFLINCKGKASGFQVISGEMNDELDKRIIEALVKLQNWIPGKYNNETVDSTYTLRLELKNGQIILADG